MIFVLVIISSIGGGTYLTLHDFGSRDACEAARAEMARAISPPPPRPTTICIAKGGGG